MTRASRAAVLAACIATASCASGTATTAPQQAVPPVPTTAGDTGGPAMHQHAHTADLPATAGAGYTVADVRFMQNMIGHHAQAILMAELAPRASASGDVLRLAQKIDISQRDEIDMMKQWLRERGQTAPTDAQSHAMMMPGMLTVEQLAQLGAARGRRFDQLFLGFMIRHHQGALTMVEDLFASPGAGQDPDLFRFATDVDADQRDEIFVMQGMLDTIREESR